MEWLEIFDISLFRSLIRSATPIALIGFGAAMCSASGVLNIGLEGKMLNAAFVGIAALYEHVSPCDHSARTPASGPEMA